MTAVGESFSNAFGAPDPATPPGLQFAKRSQQGLWNRLHEEVGSGWFGDGFYYLFGEGLQELLPCVDAWSFLVPPCEDRMIIGRNAYGALLLLDNAGSPEDETVHVLDPFTVTCWRSVTFRFMSTIGRALPQGELDTFNDDSAYQAWLAETGIDRIDLTPTDVLGVKVPKIVGGELESSNLQLEDIVEYYQTTGAIYATAFTAEEKTWVPESVPAEIRASYAHHLRVAVAR